MRLVKPSFSIVQLSAEPLSIIEAAGRVCYKSEDKITLDSAHSFVSRIMKSGHHSVIEHAFMSVKFICDRGVTHEIVRHRLVSYSQESTRYCNYKSGVAFIIPPWINLEEGDYPIKWNGLVGQSIRCVGEGYWFWLMALAERYYQKLIEQGWTPQQARSVLPNSLKTEIVCTANLREWRHILTLRCSNAAHPQMREIMRPLLTLAQQTIPVVFDDVTY